MKVIVNHIATEYSQSGSGPVVLFLHGWMDSLHTFDAVFAQLPATTHIVCLDLPGFGQTEPPPNTWNLENYVQFVKEFLEKLQLTPEVIIGHSFGGRIAIRGIGEGTLRPKKLILIGSAGIAKTKTLRNLLFAAAAKTGKALTTVPPLHLLRSNLRKNLYRRSGSNYLEAGGLQETFLQVIKEDLRFSASRLKLPTLLIWGAKDTETPLSDGQALHKLIQDSQLEVFPEAGHFVHQEEAERVSRLVEQFL